MTERVRTSQCFDLLKMTDSIYTFCIALIPILYIINVPLLNISLGTVILLLFVPHSLRYIITGIGRKSNASVIPLFIFYAYQVLRSDGNIMRILLCIACYLNLHGMIKGAISITKLRDILEAFALLNTILLILQVIGFYVFHTRLQFIPKQLVCLEYRESYVFRNDPGLYRPSALFLEPSHFSQFCIFSLISALFRDDKKTDIKKALLIGMGCILTTSGMGIALTFGVCACYYFFNGRKLNDKLLFMIILLPIIVLALVVLSKLDFFQTALRRVFSDVDGYNAISGRTHNWADSVGKMNGSLLFLGYGDKVNFDLYLTGLADTIFKYGLICVVLEGICFIYFIVKKPCVRIVLNCTSFCILFCFAHLTNFVAQVFYLGLIITDVVASNNYNPIGTRQLNYGLHIERLA